MCRSVFILLIICVVSTAYPQDQLPEDSSDVMENVQSEKLLETTTQGDENSTAAEETAQLEDNPLNLNAASAEELQRIPFITSIMVSRIIDKRKLAPFVSERELLTIEGITPEIFSFISRFVKVKKIKQSSSVSGLFLSRFSAEMEKRKGYMNGAYPGSRLKSFNRFRLSMGDNKSPWLSTFSQIEIGALMKKDPGERSLTNFSAGFISISVPVLSSCFIAGDYQVEAAEGLILWRASAFSKGSDVIAPVRKNGGGIRPYLSSDENSYFRGIAASVESEIVHVQMFYSNKPINATIDSLGDISSMDRSGLFRTESELRKQNTSRELLFGGRAVLYPSAGFKIGGTGYYTRLSNSLILKKDSDEKVSDLWMQGLDASYTDRSVDVFSECAIDRTNALAVICGITYEPLPILAMTLVARKYPSDFNSIHGNVFGETSGQVQNENGVYVGVRIQLLQQLWISTYFDQFEHPTSTQSIPVPSHGNDFLALTEIQISKRFALSFRFKQKNSPSVINEYDLYGRLFQQVVPRLQRNYQITSEFISSPSVKISNRAEWVTVNYGGAKPGEQGILLYQSIKWRILRSLTTQIRFVVFQTDLYDSRIYEYEEDLPGTYSNPALYGRGLRWYMILRYRFLSKMHIAVKYVHTVKEGVKLLGTGLDEINGDSQNVVSGQIEIQF